MQERACLKHCWQCDEEAQENIKANAKHCGYGCQIADTNKRKRLGVVDNTCRQCGNRFREFVGYSSVACDEKCKSLGDECVVRMQSEDIARRAAKLVEDNKQMRTTGEERERNAARRRVRPTWKEVVERIGCGQPYVIDDDYDMGFHTLEIWCVMCMQPLVFYADRGC